MKPEVLHGMPRKCRALSNKTDHLCCPIDRQMMASEPWPRGNIGCHFASKLELPIRRLCQERDHQVFQRDHADVEVYQLGIRQRWNVGLHFARDRALLPAAGRRATLAF